MKEYESLLKLIATENPIKILQEPDLIEKFNELLKLELIEINAEKVVLTAKGREAINSQPSISSSVTEQEINTFGEKARIKGRTFYFLSLFLLLVSILFVLAINY